MILIIGYGFLGRSIYESLKLKGFEVFVISRAFEDAQNKDFIKCELSDIPGVIKNMPDIETIIHCIHTTVPKTSMDDNVFDVQSNVIPFINLMKELEHVSLKNFIYISSGGAVYGMPLSENLIEEHHPTNPVSSYGITKLTCEKYLLMNKHFLKGNCIILRPSNIYGIKQRVDKPHGIIGQIRDTVVHNKTLEIWGDGEGKKDYLHIDCFVEGIVHVIEYKSKLNTSIYNIASGNLYSINFLVDAFEKKYQKKINVVYKAENAFDVKNIHIDNTLFSKTFNWSNFISVEEFINKL